MQVNAVLLHTNVTGGAPTMLLGTLIAQAIEPSRASVVGRTIADALLRARAGEKEVASCAFHAWRPIGCLTGP